MGIYTFPSLYIGNSILLDANERFLGFKFLLMLIESMKVKIKNWTKNYSFIVITVQLLSYNLIMNNN